MIRLATPDDELDDLAAQGGIPGVDSDHARELVHAAAEAGDCLVHVAANGDLDGFVVTRARSFFGRDFISLLAVAASHRRSGIGSALLSAAAHRATTDVIFTSTNESNLAMQALLARDSWTYSGTLTGLDEGDPELVFWRRRAPLMS